ncbi:GTP pyrophosphokinase family protein [Acetobacterium wieringae]|jgi:putative GTP pyrophosphokinase|uniref:GTP pyrophosphokinase YwaC n=2 Tax=Acetobacterium wieringae TaxID=52694 RepID=A0A1F2PJ49_9FIRM|nr:MULTISPECIES: GTP pyrophosphokinase family protein [Acetobacterium]HAZ05058.1 GTP pyrophosphokinase family protein [Acetobacterium sp.]MEA4807222.1 GTP pyrophosphokinase family protein [Acetobacterium wieringae]OFV70944.1 GTP pyrophosphokinase YwaC [Acetobacterium wieringae]OXS26777.1 MAG: GTP pyrophosphokinase [Acetobacterium sp. MES1]TYC84320.1 GTP pyrophosphokinase family protein [Acetobacterium wieringae]
MQINSTELPFSEDLDMNGSLKEFLLQQQIYRAAIKEIKTKLEILDEEFQARYDHNPIHHMEYRLKSPQSIAGKMQKKGLEITAENIRKNLTDIAGVRVICNYLHDIDRIANLLLRHDDITLIRKNDYINEPKKNGYRSLHLIVLVPIFLAERTESVPVEIQIRTIAMDFWASLEHQLKYKGHSDISEGLRERLKYCAESITRLDEEMQMIYEEITTNDCDQ